MSILEKIRGSAVATIYNKELIDTLRDRRTLATMLLVPMVAYPLTLILTTETLAVRQQANREQAIVVGTIGEVPETITDALAQTEGLRVQQYSVPLSRSLRSSGTGTSTSISAALKQQRFAVLLAVSSTAAETLAEDGTARIEIFYDATSWWGEVGVERVERTLTTLAQELRQQRFRRAGLPDSAVRPFQVITRSIASDEEMGNRFLGLYLPTLVLLFIALSSFYPAVDLIAGEKERKTLSTLLTAPVRPIDLAWGKYLTVVTVGTLAGLLNVSVLGLTLYRIIASLTEESAIHFEITFTMVAGILLTVILIAAPIGAVMLLAGSFARSFRDASYLLTPVLLLCIVPAMLSLIPGVALSAGWAVTPLANASLLMRAILSGRATLADFGIVTLSSIVATSLLLMLVSRVFTDERVLFSTSGRRADLKGLLSRPPPPGPSTVLAFAALVFVGNYYGSYLMVLSPIGSVVVTQIGVNLLFALLLAWWMKQLVPITELTGWQRPRARYLLVGLLLGASGWLGISLPAGWLTAHLLPGHEAFAQAFSSSLGLDQWSLLVTILVLALLPALAEETVFRGVILGLLKKRMSPAAALVLQAVLFGLMHGSLYRFLPTALLGGILGLLAWRSRSIWPGFLAHFATNTILLCLHRFASPQMQESLNSPSLWAILGLLLVFFGVVWPLRHQKGGF